MNSGAGFPEGNLEMDFYGGWKTTFAEDFGLDLGGLYYYYPGSTATPLSGSNARIWARLPAVLFTMANCILPVAGSSSR